MMDALQMSMRNLKIPSSEISPDVFNGYLKQLSERNRLLDSCILEKNREIDSLKNLIRNFEKSAEENVEVIKSLEIKIRNFQDNIDAKNREIEVIHHALSDKDNEINKLIIRIKKMRTTPDGRFTDNGDGTVTDNRSGLMWKKCPEGISGSKCDSGSAKTFIWDDAMQIAEDVNTGSGFAGYNDWRLPDIDELKSVVDDNFRNPCVNHDVFINTPTAFFWSSSSVDDDESHAWVVYFGFGNVHWNVKIYDLYVRLVRG